MAADADVLLGSGTCFAISDDGLVATAAHVVEGAQEIVVRFGEDALLPAIVEAKSSAVDVAVLRIARQTKDYLRVVSDPSISLGDHVFTVGFPRPQDLGLEAKFTDGVVSSLAVGGEKSLMQISVPVHSGNSGGALVSDDAVLYGVVVAKLKALAGETTNNISYAVKATFLAAILDGDDVHRVGKPASRKEAIRLATAATCLVLTRTVGRK